MAKYKCAECRREILYSRQDEHRDGCIIGQVENSDNKWFPRKKGATENEDNKGSQ
jgi:hypothetical protein